ncbi:hypothetical protein BH11MYX3_BH11MYX3_17080 [soil metagenome]
MERRGPAGPSILIVDDAEHNLVALESVLSPLGYQLTRARSGHEALKHILEQDFALILLDVMMPGMDGFQTAALIRRSSDIPILFVTATNSAADRMKGYQHGGSDYLEKPYDPDVLRAKVQVFIELHGGREESRRQSALLVARECERLRAEVRDAVVARGQAETREAAYRFLAESIPQQVWTAGPDGGLDYVNPIIVTYFGQPAAAILGSGWLAVLHPDDAEAAVALWSRCLAAGEDYEIEFRLRRHDGEYRWHLGRAVAERGPLGTITRWSGTNTDIHDRRAMEAELQQALSRAEIGERRLQLFAESMPQVMWSMSPDGSDGYLNHRWYEYTGQDPKLPIVEKWLQALHPDDHARCFATWADARATNQSWELEYRLRRHDGSYRWHIGRSVPEVGADGVVAQWYGTAAEIHEQRMAIRSRDELLATVSHDLRNLLGTISLTSELLHEQVIDAGARRSAGSIQRASARMEQLLRDLLDVATIESGHLSIVPVIVDVESLLVEAATMVQERAAATNIHIVTEIPAGGGQVRCDRNRILQVFANLTSNAIKFTPVGGTITLGARIDALLVTFMVRDTGAGIPADQIDHVFDRFWKSKDPTKAGTGLGLAICQGIVEQHGGTLRVESTLGAGTAVFFTIPAG